ncbi:glycoside hydrolase superfamily [Phellopilus nigrolimitatus]|nr:glycoside hydrolase superfamily [Phellopilus nigrolimitatus]
MKWTSASDRSDYRTSVDTMLSQLHNLLDVALIVGSAPIVSASPLDLGHEVGTTTLKAAAGARYFGAALGAGHLSNASDTKFRTFGAQQFSGATPENEMKWCIVFFVSRFCCIRTFSSWYFLQEIFMFLIRYRDATEPSQGMFTFAQGDQVAAFAVTNDQKLRGHTLVWHSQLPDWVPALTGNALLDAMNNHITTVMQHFKGKTFAWDVVNEAFNDDGTLGSSPFLTQLGSSYIATAFATARSADPTALLYINDFGTEGENTKSNALLSLVKTLKASNLIDGVGFQSHFIVGEAPTDLQANLQRFADAGVDVAITELDVRMTTPASAANLTQQATDYAFVINACQAVSRCVGITTWGITDLYSWVPGTFAGQGAALLFDDDYNEKASFASTLDALSS